MKKVTSSDDNVLQVVGGTNAFDTRHDSFIVELRNLLRAVPVMQVFMTVMGSNGLSAKPLFAPNLPSIGKIASAFSTRCVRLFRNG